MKDQLIIFDTTMRDGEQSPGAAMTRDEKVRIGKQLERLRVDVIEAGFAASSPGDFEAIRAVAAAVRDSTVCSLARANDNDVKRAGEAIRGANSRRIHTFIATSPLHMQHKLRMDPEEVVERVVEMLGYAHSLCADVEFSPEDAGRSDPEFLYVVLAEAIKAGAPRRNVPDQVGYTPPEEYGPLIPGIMHNAPGIENVPVSVHCHDDLGLATANTLAGIAAGARQAEVTINGIGERAGNTSLEEVVMALHTRRAVFNLTTGIDTTQLMRASKLVSNYTGIVVQPNKAIVGANAFAHEAGIHQDGLLKHQQTYEIMRPEVVGVTHTRLVVGKHSGRHAFKARLGELGYELSEAELDKAFARFKDLADKKKVITDADLEALVADEFYQPREVYTLDGLQVACGTIGMPTATVRLRVPDRQLHIQAAIGTGPVDACYKAIDTIVGAPSTLLEFSVHAVTEGIDALGEVSVRIQSKNGQHTLDAQKEIEQPRTFGGHGADTDIIVASVKAYLAALNKLLAATGRHGTEAEKSSEVRAEVPA